MTVYKIRVTLNGIKGFYRVYEVNGATSLYTLHKQLRADLEFPQGQLIMFKGLNVSDAVTGRWGLFDLGSGSVDQISLAKAVKDGTCKFVYFYDVTNKKSVNIAVEEEVENSPATPDNPILTDVKGPNPIEFENGYVAFEDLPDKERYLPGEREDEDFDDDDEDIEEEEEEDDDDDDEGDEDGEEIYDGEQ